MTRCALIASLVAVMTGLALGASEAQEKPAVSVAGRWTMTVEGGPHGVMTMGLALEQEKKKVTGTFASPHGDLPVEGEFVDGALTLATVSKDHDAPAITFNAKLNDDKLTGYLSSSMGDMTWTATRAREGR